MATHVIPPSQIAGAPQLTAEEGWELILRSLGSAKELYADCGGGEAWLRAEREAWGEEQPRA